jgi:hypothetical protein
VQEVGEAEEPVVLPRIVEVEDVLGGDADLADARARRLELGERRQQRGCFCRYPGRWLRLRPPGRPGQGREANESANLN